MIGWFLEKNNFDLMLYFWHRSEAALRKHLLEHGQKAALSSDKKKVEISLEFAKTRGLAKTRISKNLRPTKFKSHALTIQPRMHKITKN